MLVAPSSTRVGLRISDLEEQRNLLSAILASEADSIVENPQSAQEATHQAARAQDRIEDSESLNAREQSVREQSALYVKNEREKDAEDDEYAAYLLNESNFHNGILQVDDEEKLREGGRWYQLPQVLVDAILLFLGDADMYGYLIMTCKSTFQPNERVYRYLCEYIYTKQAVRKVCSIDHWKTWKNMLIYRPRLRTNGFYTLRTIFSKAHCNDAFWEEKQFESIEVKYYRHLRFFNNGKVLYSLDVIEPNHIARLLESGETIAKRVFLGTYSLRRNEIRVEIKLHYCDMIFDLLLQDGDDGYIGKHNMLTLLSHSSVSHAAPPVRLPAGMVMEQIPSNLVHYHIPINANFRFYRFWHFRDQYKLQ